MTSLNKRRERFARGIAAGKTNHQAAIEAGYSPHSADVWHPKQAKRRHKLDGMLSGS
jgi:phage terminase small subunit